MSEDLIKELVSNLKELNYTIKNLNKQVYTAKEAAKYLRIGYETVLMYARIGEIEHVKNGNQYIFKKEYLDKWLDKNTIREVR